MNKLKLFFLSAFALLFAFWLGSGIAYEINPRWFLSETATEIPPNPNKPVGMAADFLRRANLIATAASTENISTSESVRTDSKQLASIEDYLASVSKLEMFKREAEQFHDIDGRGNPRYHTVYSVFKNELVEVSVSGFWQDGRHLTAVYTYLNNLPFSAEIFSGIKKTEEDSGTPTGKYLVVWQPDGSVFQQSGEGVIGVQDYERCAVCYSEAVSYLNSYADVKNADRFVREAEQKRNRIAADSRDYVFYENLTDIMPRGMTANSLTVGFDTQGLPQKIYWSFDNGKRRQSFEYYLENGKPFLVQSSSVPLVSDGKTADFDAPQQVQTWFISDGKVLKENIKGTMPDIPLNMDTLEADIRRYTTAVQR